ncbi:unnamed protein product [Cunninghamella blakesleeana]
MMISLSSLSLLLSSIFILFTTHVRLIDCQSNNNNQVKGRVLPGCVLIVNKVYCFGGFTGGALNNGVVYQNSLNDHISLDLTALGSFSEIDQSRIQWTNRSNTLNGIPLGALAQLGTAVLSDGSYVIYGGRNSTDNTQPLAIYHPQSDQWEGVTLPNNDTYYIRTQIVNLGNDRIWIWGGDVPVSLPNLTVDMFYIYDYKSKLFPTVQTLTTNISSDHTATLVNNIIYIIGGATLNAQVKGRTTIPFDIFQTYNTLDGTWGSISTNGSKPVGRAFHTTVATADNKHLIIYGGSQPFNGKFQICNDVYYIYDIENNNLQGVDISNPPGLSGPQRFGHFATLYNSTYLLLFFGYNDLNTPIKNNLHVLNVENISQPKWITFASNDGNSTQQNDGGNKGVDIKTIVPAVVVPVVLVLSAAAVAFFFFIRHRKRKQKKQFILEQEDPRKLLDTDINNNNNNGESYSYSDGGTRVMTVKTESIHSLTVYQYQHDEVIKKSDHHDSIKPSEFNEAAIKPSELNEKIKPSER